MYIAYIPNRSSRPTVLIRQDRREGKKIIKQNLANITHLPPDVIEQIEIIIHGGTAVQSAEHVFGEAFEQSRSWNHGHVAAVLGTLRKLGVDKLMDRTNSRKRALCAAMITARIINPRSKLATATGLCSQSHSDSLGEVLGLGDVSENDLYEAMDWLLERQGRIEKKLSAKHLEDGSVVLCDVTSSYMEGKCCPLGARGYSRDRKKGKLQIVYGLLCDAEGVPVGVEVFSGNTSDPKTLGSQVKKLTERFGLSNVIVVGDRGLLTSARIKEEIEPLGFDWITALKYKTIRSLLVKRGFQFSLFDGRGIAEITSDEYPGERLVVCRNPLMADRRGRKREELLLATEAEIEKVVSATRRRSRRLAGKDDIGVALGKVINKYKVGKHFEYEIEDDGLTYRRNEGSIEEERAFDGIYLIRTSVSSEVFESERVVETYKRLSNVEQAFRSFKQVDLKVRPIYHYSEDRVRAHVFLCMLAYYVEFYMRKKLAPVLFVEDDPCGVRRESVVSEVKPSESAKRKARSKRTTDGHRVQSFRGLLGNLGNISRSVMVPKGNKRKDVEPFYMITKPTPLQSRAFELLGVKLQ